MRRVPTVAAHPHGAAGAAARAFQEGGFAATSLDDVAAQAGVTKMIIYGHFDSKRDLYQAVLRDMRRRIRARIGAPEQFGPIPCRTSRWPHVRTPTGSGCCTGTPGASRSSLATSTSSVSLPAVTRPPGCASISPTRRAWIASLLPAIVTEAILTWLDAAQPVGPDELVRTIRATARAHRYGRRTGNEPA
jgi:AcrR family transcriptional regulator